MSLLCTRSRTKDDKQQNNELEQRIAQASPNNMELVNMNLTDQDIPIIIQKAIRKKKCVSLSLATNNITADGVQVLVDALKTKTSLTHLILSGNPIGDDGAKTIIGLITSSRTVYHVALANTGITDHGLEILANAVGSIKNILRCLDLRSNPSITDASIEVLLQMVDNNEILSACRLDNCSISPEGRQKLREAKSITW